MRALVVVTLLTLASCRLPPPDSPAGTAIRCSTEAVQRNWHRILPIVNTCLASADDPDAEPCLIGVIDPAAGLTEAVLACVLRDQGQKFAETAAGNPADTRSARAAARAKAFSEKRRYTFAD